LVVGAVAVNSKLAAEAFTVKRPFYADDAVAAESLEEFQIRFEIGLKDLAEAARIWGALLRYFKRRLLCDGRAAVNQRYH